MRSTWGENASSRGALASAYEYGVFLQPLASESTWLVNWGVWLAPMLSYTHSKIMSRIFAHYSLRWRSPLIVNAYPKFRLDSQWVQNAAMAMTMWRTWCYVSLMTILCISDADTALCSFTPSLKTPNWYSLIMPKFTSAYPFKGREQAVKLMWWRYNLKRYYN